MEHFIVESDFQKRVAVVLFYHQQCLSFLVAGKVDGEIVSLPEHEHVETLDRGGLWKVTSIFQIAACYFRKAKESQTQKIDASKIATELMKNISLISHVSTIRSNSQNLVKQVELQWTPGF